MFVGSEKRGEKLIHSIRMLVSAGGILKILIGERVKREIRDM